MSQGVTLVGQSVSLVCQLVIYCNCFKVFTEIEKEHSFTPKNGVFTIRQWNTVNQIRVNLQKDDCRPNDKEVNLNYIDGTGRLINISRKIPLFISSGDKGN